MTTAEASCIREEEDVSIRSCKIRNSWQQHKRMLLINVFSLFMKRLKHSTFWIRKKEERESLTCTLNMWHVQNRHSDRNCRSRKKKSEQCGSCVWRDREEWEGQEKKMGRERCEWLFCVFVLFLCLLQQNWFHWFNCLSLSLFWSLKSLIGKGMRCVFGFASFGVLVVVVVGWAWFQQRRNVVVVDLSFLYSVAEVALLFLFIVTKRFSQIFLSGAIFVRLKFSSFLLLLLICLSGRQVTEIHSLPQSSCSLVQWVCLSLSLSLCLAWYTLASSSAFLFLFPLSFVTSVCVCVWEWQQQ